MVLPFKKLNPRINKVMEMAVNAPTFVSFEIVFVFAIDVDLTVFKMVTQ